MGCVGVVVKLFLATTTSSMFVAMREELWTVVVVHAELCCTTSSMLSEASEGSVRVDAQSLLASSTS